MLTIHEDENMTPVIQRRSNEELGFYSKDLIDLERLYHQRFCPDKEISIWYNGK